MRVLMILCRAELFLACISNHFLLLLIYSSLLQVVR